jgi:iron complex transport system substrate-binding protein
VTAGSRSIRFLIGVLLLATGCSSESEPERTAEPEREITVQHAAGSTTFTTVPGRAVALEWTYAENLLALDVQPVGVADIAGFEKWVELPVKLADSVTDVGTRQEPSLERIMALEPDLIVATALRHKPVHRTLSRIAPTLQFAPYGSPEGQFGQMRSNFRKLGLVLDREPQADRVLDRLDELIEQSRRSLRERPQAERRFVLVQVTGRPQSPMFRIFADNAMAVQLLERLGLTNAWPVEHEPYGFTTVGLEALTEIGPVHFLYVAQPGRMDFLTDSDHGLWQQMAFVRAERVHDLGSRTWLFGGPLSAIQLIERVSEALQPAPVAEEASP